MVGVGKNKTEASAKFQKLDNSSENAIFESYCEIWSLWLQLTTDYESRDSKESLCL